MYRQRADDQPLLPFNYAKVGGAAAT